MSHSNFTRPVKLGGTYTVGDRTYPVIPSGVTSVKLASGAEIAWPGTPEQQDQVTYILTEMFIMDLKMLLTKTTSLLEEVGVESWVSGGTLLGMVRHGTIMPWDDDVDLHVRYSDLPRLWVDNRDWLNLLKVNGLEQITLFFASAKRAEKNGAALRIRKKGTITPVLDIFFVEKRGGDWVKLDGWNGDQLTWSTKEIWPEDELFPIQKKLIDGMTVPMPVQPGKLIERQYGKTALKSIRTRPTLFSHQTPFELLSWVWRTH